MNPDDERVTYFAETDARGKHVRFGIKAKDRSRHMYVIGKTGMGKSTMLENMAVQDIQNGEGMMFIDPHGSTAEKLLDFVPEHRIKDVLYFAPFDLDYPISFNVLERVEPDKRHLVVSGLMATFEKIWVDAWSARMAYILQNTLLALLEYPDATLLGVNRMYTDKDFRKKVVDNLTDPTARAFWVDEYAKYTDRYTQEATPAIQNKIGQFASNAIVRNIIGQPRSSFDIRSLMDQKKIFIVNLSKGRVGEGNANLLGSMLITKIYLAAMSRADSTGRTLRGLPNSYVYVDEFQSFANRSFADILSEARKYKLNLTIAHQYVEQMEEEVRSAVFGNVGTMISFRVGAYDAELLEKEFAPIFTAEDLVNLGFAQAYMKLMIDGVSSQPFSAVTLPPILEPPISNRDRVIAYSRQQYAARRDDTENAIKKWHEPVIPAPAPSVPRSSESRASSDSTRPRAAENRTSSDSPRPRSGEIRRSEPRDTPYSGNTDRSAPRREPERPLTPPSVERVEKKATPPSSPSSSSRPEQTPSSLREILAKLASAEKEKVKAKEQAKIASSPKPPEAEKPAPAQTPVTPLSHADRKTPTNNDREALKAALKNFDTAPKQPNASAVVQVPTPTLPPEIPEAELRALLAVEEPKPE
jgi:hypothetical protein